MRRLSIHRPLQKVRNPARHLRSLACWADSFVDDYPEREAKYINFKLATLDRLVEGPTAKLEWQRVAVAQLIKAALHLVAARPANEQGRSWVAMLLGYPSLWSSEVTVFFERDYLNRFIAPPHNDASICQQLGITLPANFIECAYLVQWQDEDDDGQLQQYSEQRFVIYEASFLAE